MTPIPTPTTPQCTYCKSFELEEPTSAGYRKCRTCTKFTKVEGTTYTPTYQGSYTECPGCNLDVYISQSEWNDKKVHCSRCSRRFEITEATERHPSFRRSEGTTTYSSGRDYHILLRVKGPAPRVELFHRLLKRCDSDWMFPRRATVRVCRKCLGLVWNGPRLGPADIKAAARQVGGVKVKIRHFAPVAACHRGGFDEVEFVPLTEASDLFTPGGPQRFREKHNIAMPTETTTTTTTPSEASLIGEVLDDGTATTMAPEPSIRQFPGDLSGWGELERMMN